MHINPHKLHIKSNITDFFISTDKSHNIELNVYYDSEVMETKNNAIDIITVNGKTNMALTNFAPKPNERFANEEQVLALASGVIHKQRPIKETKKQILLEQKKLARLHSLLKNSPDKRRSENADVIMLKLLYGCFFTPHDSFVKKHYTPSDLDKKFIQHSNMHPRSIKTYASMKYDFLVKFGFDKIFQSTEQDIAKIYRAIQISSYFKALRDGRKSILTIPSQQMCFQYKIAKKFSRV